MLPPDIGMENLQPHLVNHKNPIKLQLMRFLGQRTIPQALDLTYYGPGAYRVRQSLGAA